MIVYLDASALVKRYVSERGSKQVAELLSDALFIGTSLVSRAELAAALAKSVRVGALTREQAATALEAFRKEWNDFIRIQLTENLLAQADAYAWEHGLRGNDPVHLAAAASWQQVMGETITFATFDKHLSQVAGSVGLMPFPLDL